MSAKATPRPGARGRQVSESRNSGKRKAITTPRNQSRRTHNMAIRAISSKSPRPCHPRSTVCWPTRWCAGSSPRNRTPSSPRYCGRPWCSTSSRGADGRGGRSLSCQQPVTGRVASGRRIGDELGRWRTRLRAEHQLTMVAYRGLIGGVAASSEWGQPLHSTRSGGSDAGSRQHELRPIG
jgi:hypothetical protein